MTTVEHGNGATFNMRALWGLERYSLNHLIDIETDYTKTCFLKFQYNNCFIIVWTVRRIVSFVLRTLVQYHVKLILSGYYRPVPYYLFVLWYYDFTIHFLHSK